MKKLFLKTLLVCALVTPSIVYAQQAVVTPQQAAPNNFNMPIVGTAEEGLSVIINRIDKVRPDIDLNQIPSLFFTPSEQSLIAEARLGLTARAPSQTELNAAEQGEIIIGPRELALGGIVYSSSTDWTIWLNGEKITRDRLPPEIYDIEVRKDYIKLKWFDAYTNQIFPVKLRTHQRFNIDTRIFLPGETPMKVISEY